MRRLIASALFLCICFSISGQPVKPEDFGFRHIQTVYKGDTVDVLIKSKKGEEQKRKPLFLFCQGSQPIPLIMTYKDQAGKTGIYNVFVFNPDSLSERYHLVMINKPYVPLIYEADKLGPGQTYADASGKYPRKYIERNLLDYYVGRNIAVTKYLQTLSWVGNDELVVAGHSEGASIAARMAFEDLGITRLIYSGGNPCGRILSMIEQQRARETDSVRSGEMMIDNWKAVVDDPSNMDALNGDANKATYGFSVPAPIEYLEKLKIPVLVTYGTKDYGCPFNDYLRTTMIQKKKSNFTFRAYIGVEHNFFPLKPNGEVNYDIFNWDKVAEDWRRWLISK